MPNAKDLLRHAVQMLLFSPATTFKVILPAFVLIIASAILTLMLVPDVFAAMDEPSPNLTFPDPGQALTFLVLLIIGLVGYALMAILWHRHVLLNGSDRADILRPGAGIIRHYIWRAIVVAFVQVLAAIPIIIVMGILGAALSGISPAVMLTIISFLGGIAFAWVALRISVVLPAASLGETMRISESWALTAPLSQRLVMVAGFLAILNVAFSLVSRSVIPDTMSVQIIAGAVIYMIEGLVFVSVLTTLYGYLVEKRDLM